MRVLGIDYGSKRIGIALGDTESGIASPWGVISNEGTERVVEILTEYMDKEDASVLVVGLPISPSAPDDMISAREEVEQFVEALRSAGHTVEVMDESFSSQLAEKLAAEGGDRSKRDDLEAAVILESWLTKNAKKS